MRTPFLALSLVCGFSFWCLSVSTCVSIHDNSTTVSVKQLRGDYYCKSIDVTFGETVWENAYVRNPNGQEEKM